MMESHTHTHAHGRSEAAFKPMRARILVVSDTRTLETDRSGASLETYLQEAGHEVAERRIVPDECERIREAVAAWAAEGTTDVILVTGGTGVTPRDVTPEAVEPLFTRALAGFGELFRMLSYEEIGSSCIQSRATGGLIDRCLVFVIPGSTGACRLAMEKILLPQLDARTRPCSFAGLIH